MGWGRLCSAVTREAEWGREKQQSGPTGNRPCANISGTELVKAIMCSRVGKSCEESWGDFRKPTLPVSRSPTRRACLHPMSHVTCLQRWGGCTLFYGWAVATHSPARSKEMATWRAASLAKARSTFFLLGNLPAGGRSVRAG